jgi:chromosomal replication initiator protein
MRDRPPTARLTASGGALTARYTFANFVVGGANEAAYAAASAVAVTPGHAYNPLFVHGPTGLGKTHLMQAVAHEAIARWPALRLRYLSASAFLDACVRSIAEGELNRFRLEHKNVDILLLDDVHVLAGRADVLREFATVFSSMIALGRQVMLTSDRPLDRSGIASALATDYSRGYVAAVGVPSFEHRVAILRTKLAAEAGKDIIPDDVIALVATVATENIRAVEGALTRLLALSRLRRAPVTYGLAREALRVDRAAALVAARDGSIAPATIVVDAVAREWGVPPDDITGAGRTRAVVLPRQVAMFLCRDLARLAFPEIGRAFGGRDHSTVMHNVERAAAAMAEDAALQRRVTTLRRTLEPMIG